MDAQCTLSTAGHSVGRGICKSELLCEYLYFKFFYFGTSSGLHDALQPMSRGPFKIDRTAPAGPAPLRGRSGASVAPGPLSGGSRARAAGVVGSGEVSANVDDVCSVQFVVDVAIALAPVSCV